MKASEFKQRLIEQKDDSAQKTIEITDLLIELALQNELTREYPAKIQYNVFTATKALLEDEKDCFRYAVARKHMQDLGYVDVDIHMKRGDFQHENYLHLSFKLPKEL